MKTFRGLFFMLILLWVPGQQTFAQRDMIIQRDGVVHSKIKVLATTTDSTYYQTKLDKKVVSSSVSNVMIYLIKYQKRGNVYFTLEGKQFTGDIGSQAPHDATAIYLLEGRELWGYNLIASEDKITYQMGKKKNSQQITMSKDDIFLILYPDGTRDVVNDFSVVQKQREAELERERQKAEAEKRAREAAMFPKVGKMKTVTGKEYTVTIVSENDGVYVFTKDDIKVSPLFQIKKKYVSELDVKYKGL